MKVSKLVSCLASLTLGWVLIAAGPALGDEMDLDVTTANRVVVDASKYPWSAVGRINISGVGSRSHCTGALIGERLVLTAAHCLYYRSTKRYVAPSLVHFVAGYQRGDFVAHSIAVQLIPAPGFQGELWADPSNMEHDWALVVLQEPIGRKTGYLGFRALTPDLLDRMQKEDRFFFLSGYPRDRAHAISVDKQCRIERFLGHGELLSHSCAIVGGDSGAPITVETSRGLDIVALNSATHVPLTDGTITNTAVPVHTILTLIERVIRETEESPRFAADHQRSGRGPVQPTPTSSDN